MTDILKRFAWWEWAVIGINFIAMIVNLLRGEYEYAWYAFAFFALTASCALWGALYSMLEDENKELRRELAHLRWK